MAYATCLDLNLDREFHMENLESALYVVCGGFGFGALWICVNFNFAYA